MVADSSVSIQSAADISFSSIDSESQGWRTSNPILAGALFSIGFNHLTPSPLQYALEEAKMMWFRSFNNQSYFEGVTHIGRRGRRGTQHLQASLISSSVSSGSSRAISTMAFQSSHSSSAFSFSQLFF